MFNLFQLMTKLGAEVVVVRNDEITLDGIAEMHPEGIVISPGPGTPARLASRAKSSADSGPRYRSRSLPGTPVHCRGLWRDHNVGARADARQELPRLPHRTGDFQGTRESYARYSVPLADARPSDLAPNVSS